MTNALTPISADVHQQSPDVSRVNYPVRIRDFLVENHRRVWRTVKHVRQRLVHNKGHPPAIPVFLIGVARSGTNMIMNVAERHPEIWVYNEMHSAAFRNWMLKPLDQVDKLIDNCPATVVLFKPLTESHRIEELFRRYKNSRAIWVFRNYADVSVSAERRWPGHFKQICADICNGDTDHLGWRAPNIDGSTVALLRRLYHDNISPEDGAALFWCCRNDLLFKMNMHQNSRVLMIRYEEFVRKPENQVRRISDFLKLRKRQHLVNQVHQRSVNQGDGVKFDPKIASACDEITSRLMSAYRSQV